MTWDEATTVTNDRAEAALNPERRTSLQVAAESDYDPDGTYLPRPTGPDPWFCNCGEPLSIDEPACTHGRFLCAWHVDRCPECVEEMADARDDLERRYHLENRP